MVPQGVAVVLGVRAYRQRPKTHYKRSGSLSALGARSVHPIKRPDLDNIVKLVMDGLNGVAFHDDSQVIEIHAFSEWAHVNGPGVLIKVMAVHE